MDAEGIPYVCVGRGGLGWKVDAERIPYMCWGGSLGWKEASGQEVVLESKFCQDKLRFPFLPWSED